MDTRGATRRWTGSVVARACKSFVTRLPAEAADALVVDTVFLVMSSVVAGKAEWFFRCDIAKREMIEFLEEGESIRMMEGVYKIGLLFIYARVGGPDVFEMEICLVGTVQSEEGAARLAVGENWNFQLFVI